MLNPTPSPSSLTNVSRAATEHRHKLWHGLRISCANESDVCGVSHPAAGTERHNIALRHLVLGWEYSATGPSSVTIMPIVAV